MKKKLITGILLMVFLTTTFGLAFDVQPVYTDNCAAIREEARALKTMTARVIHSVHNVDTGLNYSTIQAAIDANETLDGHTIVVDAGNYTENVDVYKPLSIFGAGVANAMIYAYNPNDHVFYVTANNVTIQGFMITGATGAGKYGVYLDGVDHCEISDNFVIDNDGGIFLWGSNDNTISGNKITNISPYTGVGVTTLDYSCHNRIMNNHLSFNHYGIGVHNGSNYNLVSGNFVNSSDVVGVRLNWLGAGFASVTFNNITNNIICNNDHAGILLDEPAPNNFVYNNLIHSNYYGIQGRADCIHYNTITHNTVISNTYGIRLESTHSNLIYDNLFNNSNNAWDNGVNFWNMSKHAEPNIIGGAYIGGNYWSDNLNPVDVDQDGIGDVPYEIPGDTNKDYLPLVTEQPIFIAAFMTPEGEPYPFDMTISNGTWRREFKNVTYIETEVPCNATYTYTYLREYRRFYHNFRLSLSFGEFRAYEFYAFDFSQIEFRSRPYIMFQEVGANANLSWEWNPEVGNLTWILSGKSGKSVSLIWAIDHDASEPPNYVFADIGPGPAARCELAENHDESEWCPYDLLHSGRYYLSNVTGYCVFHEIDPGLGTIRVGYGLHEEAIVVYPIKTTLRSLNGTLFEKQFVDPQYAVPPDSYILSTDNIPEGHLSLDYPIDIKAGKGTNIDNFYMPKIPDLGDFTFDIAAENAFAHSSYSGLTHALINKTLTVNVGTETHYDWWGFFVLPRDRMVRTLTGYSGNTSYQLSKFCDYTENFVDDHNIVAVRIPPEMDGLNLTYTVFGDINGDGKVDIRDILIAAKAYGSHPGHPRWNPRADIDYNFKVDIRDILTIAKQYGATDC